MGIYDGNTMAIPSPYHSNMTMSWYCHDIVPRQYNGKFAICWRFSRIQPSSACYAGLGVSARRKKKYLFSFDVTVLACSWAMARQWPKEYRTRRRAATGYVSINYRTFYSRGKKQIPKNLSSTEEKVKNLWDHIRYVGLLWLYCWKNMRF